MDLKDLYIDQTYHGLLHAGGIPLSEIGQTTIFDGDGNKSSISLGRENYGAKISGTLTTDSLSSTSGNFENLFSKTLTCQNLQINNINLDLNGNSGMLAYKYDNFSVQFDTKENLLNDFVSNICNNIVSGLDLSLPDLNPSPEGTFNDITTLKINKQGLVTGVATSTLSPSPAGTYSNIGSITVNNRGQVTNVLEQDPPIIDISLVVNQIYPVGSVYLSIVDRNPYLHLGVGTWVKISQGRYLAGVGTGTDSNNQTRTIPIRNGFGEYRNTLSVNNLPSHTHSINPPEQTTSSNGTHSHNINPPQHTTSTSGSHTHTPIQYAFGASGTSGEFKSYVVEETINSGDISQMDNALSTSGSHTHTINIPSFTSDSGGSHTHTINIPIFDSGPTGGNTSHENSPPVFGIYVWERIN